jgi:hypothetical protein
LDMKDNLLKANSPRILQESILLIIPVEFTHIRHNPITCALCQHVRKRNQMPSNGDT